MMTIRRREDDAGSDRPSARECATVLGEGISGEVTTDQYMLHLYSRDASMYAIEPFAVAFPRNADDVVALIAGAKSLGIPVIGEAQARALQVKRSDAAS